MNHLFLYGPPGSGKSTLGKLLARRLARPFVDLDAEIEKAAGRSIPAIFAAEGEAGFRARELRALEEVSTRPRAVVALGGGALVNAAARAVAERCGTVVCLDCSLDELCARIARAPGTRPPVAAGEVSVAVLPEPMLTMARSGNENLVTAMDLTAEWDKVAPEGSLVQGCVVVRAEFAAEHPNEVAKFLEEYGSSIEFLSGDTETVGAVIEESGVFAKGAVAAKALPNCNVCFITGEEMKAAMADFLQIMYETAPASIGGEIPGDDFYYIG